MGNLRPGALLTSRGGAPFCDSRAHASQRLVMLNEEVPVTPDRIVPMLCRRRMQAKRNSTLAAILCLRMAFVKRCGDQSC
jgi:hypothetical protein